MAILLVLLVLLLGLGGVGSSSSGGSAASAREPALSVTSLDPLHVRGTGFRPGERVRVSVTAARRAVKTARAGGGGGFSVAFGSFAVDRCSAFVLRARGSGGSQAAREVGVRACPPPLHSSG